VAPLLGGLALDSGVHESASESVAYDLAVGGQAHGVEPIGE
jgi:hypothetical protein